MTACGMEVTDASTQVGEGGSDNEDDDDEDDDEEKEEDEEDDEENGRRPGYLWRRSILSLLR